MKNLLDFIKNFIERSGTYVFITTVFSRLLSFFASWISLQLIDHQSLGVVIFAFNIVSFMIPLGGLGLQQSLIRYGSFLKTPEDKKGLFVYVFKKGLLVSFLLIAVIILFSLFIDFSFEKTRYYLILLSFAIVPFFLFELIKIQFRLDYNNKMFSYAELTYNLILVLMVFSLSYFYKENGYAASLILAPLVTSVFFLPKLNINFRHNPVFNFIDRYFWRYGFYAGLSGVLTQLLFAIDIFLIGYLLKDATMVTNFRYVSIIPYSILFLPTVFINTDFVAFTEKIKDTVYIRKYIRGYMYFFTFASMLLLIFSLFFSKKILKLFDNELIAYNETFLILILGVCGILIFRGLFGNLLSSIGKAHINYYVALVALAINIISNYYLIPLYGIKGAAITSAVLMWGTGLLSFYLFLRLYKSFKPI